MRNPSLRLALVASIFAALGAAASPVFTAAQPMERSVIVGGAAMYPSKNIIENAVNSKVHTTLVAAVRAADLVPTLSSAGPFTVFAPDDMAFAKLPAGTVDTLVKPENKATLAKILTYHVVPGRISAGDITRLAAANNGKAVVQTVQGATLSFSQHGSGWIVTDTKGGTAMITIADVNQSNGVIHVIDTVLMP
jgi:uncharacterized surface protein with fasciclin (FAS1) repeats